MIANDWQSPPKNLLLNDDEIHVWLIRIQSEKKNIEKLRNQISADEFEKSNRYVFEKDRSSYLVSRGILRILLAQYLNLSPKLIKFKYNKYGKPYLGMSKRRMVQFNLSHSNEYCLIAISKFSEIGVDIEWISKDIIPNEIAIDYFSHGYISQAKF